MQYQKMHTRHLKAVIDIEESIYTDPWTKKQLRNMLPNENARMFTVVENHEVIAYMIMHKDNNDWLIENLTVAKEHQRRGIGTQLLSLAKTTAGPRSHIRLYVADMYLPMHLLLRNMGYIAVEIEKDTEGCDYYLFMSELTVA